MKKIMMVGIFYTTLLFILQACKKQENISGNGAIQLEFEHRVGNQSLVLSNQTYTSTLGQDFKINVFKYYVSNLKLTKADGSFYSVPESYFLIDASNISSLVQNLSSIPAGDYTGLEATIGVDSLRNFSGAQTGALDPAKGMFWTWNSGYIFVKLEGTSSYSTATNQSLVFHIGGAKSPNNTIRKFTQQFSSPLRVRVNSMPTVHFITDAGSLFRGTNNIDFSQLNLTMGGPNSVLIANNYVSGFLRVDHVHN